MSRLSRRCDNISRRNNLREEEFVLAHVTIHNGLSVPTLALNKDTDLSFGTIARQSLHYSSPTKLARPTSCHVAQLPVHLSLVLAPASSSGSSWSPSRLWFLPVNPLFQPGSPALTLQPCYCLVSSLFDQSEGDGEQCLQNI